MGAAARRVPPLLTTCACPFVSPQLSFAVIVYPSLLLTYLGQTSMIVSK